MDLTGQYSNPSGPLKPLLEAASSAASEGHRRPFTPSGSLPPGLRPGAIERAVLSVLSDAVGPIRNRDVHASVEERLEARCRTTTFARSYRLQRVIRRVASLACNGDGTRGLASRSEPSASTMRQLDTDVRRRRLAAAVARLLSRAERQRDAEGRDGSLRKSGSRVARTTAARPLRARRIRRRTRLLMAIAGHGATVARGSGFCRWGQLHDD